MEFSYSIAMLWVIIKIISFVNKNNTIIFYLLDIILQDSPAITFRTIGGVLDFYFFTGPSPAEVIQQYTAVIGRPSMPPFWGLGFHLCRYGYKSTERTKEIWKRNIDAGIPLVIFLYFYLICFLNNYFH